MNLQHLYSLIILFTLLLIGPSDKKTLQAQNANATSGKSSATNVPEIPSDLVFERDIAYREGHPRWVLNLLRPRKKSANSLPAIVVVHGGGWNSNDHYRFTQLGIDLAQAGYVVITPTHRMIQDAPFPACLEDIKNSVRWLRAHAKKYNIDPNRIGACGNSSGGQLALMTALTGKSKLFEGEGTHLDQPSIIQAIACSGTVGDMQHAEHSQLAKRVYRNLAGARVPGITEKQLASVMKQASPVNYISKQAPPVLMIHGGKDTTVFIQSTDEFVEKMKTASANITYRRFPKSGHGVMLQRNLNNVTAMIIFFDQHLK